MATIEQIEILSDLTGLDKDKLDALNISENEAQRKINLFESGDRLSDIELNELKNKIKNLKTDPIKSKYYVLVNTWNDWNSLINSKNFVVEFANDDNNNLIYDKMKINDHILFYQKDDSIKKFNRIGYFGYGKITNKISSTENFSINKFQIEPLYISSNDENLIFENGVLHVTSLLNEIENTDEINKIQHEINTNWINNKFRFENYLLIKTSLSVHDSNNLILNNFLNHSEKLTTRSHVIFFNDDSNSFKILGYGDIAEQKLNDSNELHLNFSNLNFFNHDLTSTQSGGREINDFILNKIKSKSNLEDTLIPIEKEIYELLTLESFSDSPLPIPDDDQLKSGIKKITHKLLISEEKVLEIIDHLIAGRHILLTGPVGTGKTSIGMMIPEIFGNDTANYVSEDYTATNDWTTQDIIGGIFPKMKDNQVVFDIQYGCVTETVIKNWENGVNQGNRCYSINSKPDGTISLVKGIWLLIDEFNRADIDKAFGQLFTALRTKRLKIPTNISNKSYLELKIPDDFRIIGTLNTSDKHHLFELSDALKSRFAHVEIDIPSISEKDREIYFALKYASDEIDFDFNDYFKLDDENQWVIKNDKDFFNVIQNLYKILSLVRIFKKFGTAVLKLVYQNLLSSIITQLKYYDHIDYEKLIDTIITSNLIPLLENLSQSDLEIMISIFENNFVENLTQLKSDNKLDNYENSIKNISNFLKPVDSKLYQNLIDSNLQVFGEKCKEIEKKLNDNVFFGQLKLEKSINYLKELKNSSVF